MKRLGVFVCVILLAGCGGDGNSDRGKSKICRKYPAQYMLSGKTYACEWIATENIHHCFNEDNDSIDNHYESEADFIREFSIPGLFTRVRSDFLGNGQPFYHYLYDYDDVGALLSLMSVSDISEFDEMLNSIVVYTSHDAYSRPLTGSFTGSSVDACSSEAVITNNYDDPNNTYVYSYDYPDDCTDLDVEYVVDKNGNIINMSFAGNDFPITILSTEVLCSSN